MVAAGADLEQARSGGEAGWALELAGDAGPTWKVEAVNGRRWETMQWLLLVAGEAEAGDARCSERRRTLVEGFRAGTTESTSTGERDLALGSSSWLPCLTQEQALAGLGALETGAGDGEAPGRWLGSGTTGIERGGGWKARGWRIQQ